MTKYLAFSAVLMLLGLIGDHARKRAKAKHEADVKEAFGDTYHMVLVMLAVLTLFVAIDVFLNRRGA